VTILSLGSDVVLSIAQKTPNRSVEVDLGASSGSKRYFCASVRECGLICSTGADSEGEEPINGAGPSHAITPLKVKRKVSTALGKFIQQKGIVRITLVHGDVLILSGDDFEVSSGSLSTVVSSLTVPFPSAQQNVLVRVSVCCSCSLVSPLCSTEWYLIVLFGRQVSE
jgi:hypothetical protein